MATDSFSDALSQLDPASRALLDLSLRRGMRPEDIGDLLGTDPESVIVAREGALEQLASRLGMADVTELDAVRSRLAELPTEAWTARTPPEPEPEPEEATPEPAGPAEPADAARKNRLPLLLALLAVAALALVALLVTRGNDQTAGAPPAAPTPAASKPTRPVKPRQPAATPIAPAAPPASPKVRLAPVAGSAGATTATASLAGGGRRLLLNVKGLPDPGTGRYEVWLYDSVIDAQSIGSARASDLNMDLKLPTRAGHFTSLDVSLEPNDGNPNHSGQSVLRVPLSKLSR